MKFKWDRIIAENDDGMIRFFCAAIFALLFASCVTTKVDDAPKEYLRVEDYPATPPLLTKLPEIEFYGKGIKYEFEHMLLERFVVNHDKNASGQFAARMLDESASAQLKVKFPRGTYECLVNEKAPDSEHSVFYVFLDNTPYRVFPSNPPTGDWELTVRSPVYFVVEEETSILVTIKSKTDYEYGDTNMLLDYIQFVKR